MATLTEVSYYTRQAVRWGAVAFGVILVTPLVWGGVKKAYLAWRPPPPPPPTVRYGKLPPVAFPVPPVPYKPTLKLETIEGGLRPLPAIAKVYLVEINKSRLLALERVKPKARLLGFTAEPQALNDQTFKFIHSTLPAQLTMNIISNSFSYRYDWTVDQSLYTPAAVGGNQQALAEAKNFFQSLGLLAADLAGGSAKFSYFAAQPPEMVPTSSLSEANFIRVDLFRAAKDDLLVVTVGGQTSPVNIIFSATSDRSKRVVAADYNYSQILAEDFATYPLKTVDMAWNELLQGGGFIAQAAGPQVTVRQVSLAYYEPDQPQEFLQPVFVFAGDDDFTAFVAAVDPSYQE